MSQEQQCFKNFPEQSEFRFVHAEGRPGVWMKFTDGQAMNKRGDCQYVNEYDMVVSRAAI